MGGTLISDKYVLTAADKIYGQGLPSGSDDLAVVVGDHDRTIPSDGQQKIKAVSASAYPGWQENQIGFVIIELEERVQLRPEIGIVCLPMNTSETFPDGDLIASGWGQTVKSEDGDPSHVLKAMPVKETECTEEFVSFGLCIFSSINGTLCIGDAGGMAIIILCNKVFVSNLTAKQHITVVKGSYQKKLAILET